MILVRELAQAARNADTVDELYEAALEVVCRGGGWSLGHVFQRDPTNPTLLVSTEIWWPDTPDRFVVFRRVTQGISFASGQGLPGRVMESSRPTWIEDVSDDPDFVRFELDSGIAVRGAFAVPVRREGELLAVMEFYGEDRRHPDDELLDQIDDLRIQLGWVVELKAREEESDASRRQMERIVAAMQAIEAAGMDPDPVMQATAEQAQALTSATSAGVYVSTDRDSNELVMKGTSGNAEPYRGSAITLDDTLSGYAFHSGEILVSRDCAADPRINQDLVGSTGVRSMVVVPLANEEGRPVGLLNVMSNQAFAFDDKEVKVLELLSRYMGSALARSRAFHQNEELVHELSRTSKSLEEALERMEAILDASLHPIVAMDSRGNVTLWSRAAEELYGWSEEEVIGGPPPMIPEELKPIFQARIERVRAGETLQNVDGYHVRRDGARVDVRLSATSLLDREGKVGSLVIDTDVTRLRSVEARLLHAERLESIGRLAGGVAHDFNNMLTAIHGHADLLLTSDLTEEDKESVRDILKAVTRSAYITKQLLAYSRRQHLETRLVYPSASIADMSGLLNRLLGERVTLTLDLEPDAGPVLVDPAQIDQVVMNLVVNARDALPAAGEVRIETRIVEIAGDDLDEVDGMEQGSYVRISVSDDGEGIAPELQGRIFEPFFSTKGPAKGTGLGLATVDGVVHQSGGGLRLESEVGRGSTFHVYLPIASDGGGDDTARHGWEVEDNAVILLVQEPGMIQRLFRRILEPRGYSVLSTPGRTRSLELLAESEDGPDLLVTDITHGPASPREYVESVRKLRPDLPILFIADDPYSFAWEDELEHLGRITKPFSPGTLEDVVTQLITVPAKPSGERPAIRPRPSSR